MLPTSADNSRDVITLKGVDDTFSTKPASSDVDTNSLPNGINGYASSSVKKKKKKKTKKSVREKEAPLEDIACKEKGREETESGGGRPPVLCISRNKHWRYISSYHGPWLQLPVEVLETFLAMNIHPPTISTTDLSFPQPLVPSTFSSLSKQRDRGFHSLSHYSHSPPESAGSALSSVSLQAAPLPPQPAFPMFRAGKATPPLIDPGVFLSVTRIRRLIDEAAELSVRATSGLTAAELGSMKNGSSLGGNSWAAAQSLGLNYLGVNNGGGRNVAMSSMRIHRLRAMAVRKLAEAYRADEIASSVMVMQGGTVFDDIAERVLKHDPNDLDAKYVHFFHEKIPSRQLAESTSTKVLDELIFTQPHRLELYRTRGIVHCFRDEYVQATKDFTHALKEARSLRKAKVQHRVSGLQSEYPSHRNASKTNKRRKAYRTMKATDQVSCGGTSPINGSLSDGVSNDGFDEPPLVHPSTLPTAPEPIEPQVLFLRGAAFLQHALHLIEQSVLAIEEVRKVPSLDGAEMRLCYIENGKYGGVEIGNPDGPLGKKDGKKVKAYRRILASDTDVSGVGGPGLRTSVEGLLRKSIRDHERFLAHFDSVESVPFQKDDFDEDEDIVAKIEYAFVLCEMMRPGYHPNRNSAKFASPSASPSTTMTLRTPSTSTGVAESHGQVTFMTYHPLIVESHFSILICRLMLADFINIVPGFTRTASLVEWMDGYPVFVPPRSMGQGEFVEVLERLAGGWNHGVRPHRRLITSSGNRGRGKERLAIMGKVPLVPSPPFLDPQPTKRAESPAGSTDASHNWLGSDEGASSSTCSSVSPSTMCSRKSSSVCFHDLYIQGCCGTYPNGDVTPTQSESEFMKTPETSTSANMNGCTADHNSYPKRLNGAQTLECARILLAPVVKRQKERAEQKAAAEEEAIVVAAEVNRNGKSVKKKVTQPTGLNIPMHGPKVEIILAWLGAVHLPELEEYR